MIVKLSLVAAFMMTMATLTLAASSLPSAEATEIAPVEAVAFQGVVRTSGSQAGQYALPAGVVPEAAVALMASL